MKIMRSLGLLIGLVMFFLLVTPIEGSANWWDKFGEPKYGGKIILTVDETSNLQFDPGDHPYDAGLFLLYFDTLVSNNWTLDRSIWNFKTNEAPLQYLTGCLAESWEQPDMQTLILHVRPGIHWHNKAPVNGREFTAEDIAFYFDRRCGTGHGFTQPLIYSQELASEFESATVNDKYTVTLKFKRPSITVIFDVLTPFRYHEAPEWVALAGPPDNTPAEGPPKGGPPGGGPPKGGPPGGDTSKGGPPKGGPPPITRSGPLNDWKNAVGTGPWILTNFVDGSSLNFVKNPDYWGHDERHPQNRVPYADKLDVLCIPDDATAYAALRTGKIDILADIHWQQARTLQKSNPKLQMSEMPKAGCDVLFNLNKTPFTDINVRKALQMAIDLKTIAKSYYGGIVDGTPSGQIHPIFKDYAFTYDQWPQPLKDAFAYNPEKAKELLAGAGYPKGFKTQIAVPNVADIGMVQIVKSMFMDVGVDMEIKIYDIGAYINLILSEKHEQMAWSEQECGSIAKPSWSPKQMSSYAMNPSTVKDPVYDDMCRKITAAKSLDELKQITVAADKYALEHHWKVRFFPIVTYNLYQPYLKGYSGELISGLGGDPSYYARWWKDGK